MPFLLRALLTATGTGQVWQEQKLHIRTEPCRGRMLGSKSAEMPGPGCRGHGRPCPQAKDWRGVCPWASVACGQSQGLPGLKPPSPKPVRIFWGLGGVHPGVKRSPGELSPWAQPTSLGERASTMAQVARGGQSMFPSHCCGSDHHLPVGPPESLPVETWGAVKVVPGQVGISVSHRLSSRAGSPCLATEPRAPSYTPVSHWGLV